jgi:hypothetical protein
MADAIVWEKDLKKGIARAKQEKKFVFLDFFNPG